MNASYTPKTIRTTWLVIIMSAMLCHLHRVRTKHVIYFNIIYSIRNDAIKLRVRLETHNALDREIVMPAVRGQNAFRS